MKRLCRLKLFFPEVIKKLSGLRFLLCGSVIRKSRHKNLWIRLNCNIYIEQAGKAKKILKILACRGEALAKTGRSCLKK